MNRTDKRLLPCPFCGTTWASLDIRSNGFSDWVECDNCGAGGPMINGVDDAMEGWNERSIL